MRVLILGATGATGKHLVELTLAEGHDVTALARERGDIVPLCKRQLDEVFSRRTRCAKDQDPHRGFLSLFQNGSPHLVQFRAQSEEGAYATLACRDATRLPLVT